MLKRDLSNVGFVSDVTCSGAEGLDIARGLPTDLVILDVMIPRLDDFGVLRRMRSAEAQFPVLLVPAKDAPPDAGHGREAGTADTVMIAVPFEVLLAHVHALLCWQEAKHLAVLGYTDVSLDTGSRAARRGETGTRRVLIRPRLVLRYNGLFAVSLLLGTVCTYTFHTRGHFNDLDLALITTENHTAEEVASSVSPHNSSRSGRYRVKVRLDLATGCTYGYIECLAPLARSTSRRLARADIPCDARLHPAVV